MADGDKNLGNKGKVVGLAGDMEGQGATEESAAELDRASRRVTLDAFVKVRGSGEREYVFRARDLSENGLFLYTRVGQSYPFKVGSTLDLELYDDNEYVNCEVVVVRVAQPGSDECDRYPAGFGVKILTMGKDERGRLESMIARCAERVSADDRTPA